RSPSEVIGGGSSPAQAVCTFAARRNHEGGGHRRVIRRVHGTDHGRVSASQIRGRCFQGTRGGHRDRPIPRPRAHGHLPYARGGGGVRPTGSVHSRGPGQVVRDP